MTVSYSSMAHFVSVILLKMPPQLFPQVNIVKFGKVQGQPFLVSELVDAIKEAL